MDNKENLAHSSAINLTRKAERQRILHATFRAVSTQNYKDWHANGPTPPKTSCIICSPCPCLPATPSRRALHPSPGRLGITSEEGPARQLSAPRSGLRGRWYRGMPKPGPQSPNKVWRQEGFCRTPSQAHNPTPRREKRAGMPIYGLTPMCQLLSLHKHQDSERIISRLPPQTGAELQETDDSVMLVANTRTHTHKARRKSTSWAAG